MMGCFGRFMFYWYLIFHFSSFPLTTIAEIEILPRSVQDALFQRIFGEKTVLLSFLNAVIANNPQMNAEELIKINLYPREPKRRVDQPRTIFDIWATDKYGEYYIVQMQRSCGPFQVSRFQHYAAQAYCNGIEIKFNAFKKKYNRIPTDHELYRNNPRVILIIITEKLSGKPFEPSLADMNKTKKEKDRPTYSIFAQIEKFGQESKFNFLFIELQKFGQQVPTNSYEKWVHFLKHTKDGIFPTELEPTYKNETSIVEALKILRENSPHTSNGTFNENWKQLIEAKDEGRQEVLQEVAKRLLKQNETSVEIQEITGLSEKEIEELKSDN